MSPLGLAQTAIVHVAANSERIGAAKLEKKIYKVLAALSVAGTIATLADHLLLPAIPFWVSLVCLLVFITSTLRFFALQRKIIALTNTVSDNFTRVESYVALDEVSPKTIGSVREKHTQTNI